MCSVHRLDPDGGCESEHIQVFEGNSTKGSLLGKFCSKHDYIPVFQSSSNTLTIQIVTDSVRIQRTVFIFYYFFSPGTCEFSLIHTTHVPPMSIEGYILSCLGFYNLESEFSVDENRGSLTCVPENHLESL